MSDNSEELKRFMDKLKQLQADTDDIAHKVVSRMADVGINVTKKNTPTGDYPSLVRFTTKDGKEVSFHVKKKQGGYLRGMWRKTPPQKYGGSYVSGYYNNTDYGMYVNNGHRVVNKDGATVGYVKGKRMLEQGIVAARRQTENLWVSEIKKSKIKGGW